MSTKEIIILRHGEVPGNRIEIIPDLAEGHLMLHDDVEPDEPDYIDHADLGRIPVPDESDGQFFSRVKQAIETLASADGSRILVVTHGHLIREMLNQVLRTPQRVRFPYENCHATSISFGGQVMINYINRNFAYDNSV